MRLLRWLIVRSLQGVALIAAGILTAIGVGWYADHVNNPWIPAGRWLGWASTTALLSYFVWLDCRRALHRPAVWLTLIGLFLVHTLGYVILFRHAPVWRPIWFVLLMLLEYETVTFLLRKVDPRVGDASLDDTNAGSHESSD